ncbi:MAG: hypothetical protein ACE5JU_05710 [Candidatus Binatia bacterium]
MPQRITYFLRRIGYWTLIVSLAGVGPVWADSHVTRKNGVVVVTLTQTPCLMVESEVNPKDYRSSKAADCIAINQKTAGERRFKTLHLTPGKVTFRVINKNVPYELGFWVRGQGLGRVTLPSVSGGGLLSGQTKEYTITLKKGAYWYSCPLNPTPNYPLIVE